MEREQINEHTNYILNELVQADIFPGELYKDRTRLPRQKFRLLGRYFNIPNQKRGGWVRAKFESFFLFGYKFEFKNDFFYEVWFDPFRGVFMIFDSFAGMVGRDYRMLDDAIDFFIDLIAEMEPIKPQAKKQAKGTLFNTGKKKASNIKDSKEYGGKPILEEVDDGMTFDGIQALLERTAVTRDDIAAAVNQEIRQYTSSKMNEMIAKSFWQVWGRRVRLPKNFISRGLRGKLQRVMGVDKQGTFVTGYALKDKLFLEIWYIFDKATRQGSYYVFDLTSKEVWVKEARTLREAEAKLGRRIALPIDIDKTLLPDFKKGL